MKIRDSAGVFSVHGLTGVIGGLISAAIAGSVEIVNYGDSLYSLFPAMGAGRGRNIQGGYQLATVGLVIGLPIIVGILVGFLLRIFSDLNTPFDDEEFWAISHDEVAEYKKTDVIQHQLVEIKQSEAQV